MTIRKAVVAGQFYPENPKELGDTVEACLAAAHQTSAPVRVAALMVPHAGYDYSGPTAGHAYARVRGASPGRVIVLGRSHRYYFDGASIFDGEACETPLGRLPVDQAFAAALAQECAPGPPEAQHHEHCLEVQFPFIQVALGAVPVVPVLFGSEAGETHIRLGKRLAVLLDPGDLVIASTDLSHFLTDAEAREIDAVSLERVMSKDYRALCEELQNGVCSMCGGTAVVCAMAYALERGADDWRLLDARTSADSSGDYRRVVGYGAISMEYEA
jgi:MEMO1 family protein